MNFIKNHKIAVIVITLCLILIVLALISISKMMLPSSSDINGNRLANEIYIDSDSIEKILNKLKSDDDVIDATYNKNIRILKFFITFESNTKLEDAKKTSDIILSNLSNEILDYYDVEVFLSSESFTAIGQCFKGSKTFYFNGDGGLENE